MKSTRPAIAWSDSRRLREMRATRRAHLPLAKGARLGLGTVPRPGESAAASLASRLTRRRLIESMLTVGVAGSSYPVRGHSRPQVVAREVDKDRLARQRIALHEGPVGTAWW